ncbi:MAG: DUF1836 domain-containing protein [Clostridia bacterium]|nr:DUF1836 domain-containing protein [Clostridia bacterium]
MYLTPKEDKIPGTILQKSAMGNVTGLDFLNKIFYLSPGIMLAQIREIAGIDGSTLQNWTKRGWVANAKMKKYDIEQLARILIINMLRDCMQLDRITFLLHYINGTEKNGSAIGIISEARLYDYICRLIDDLVTENVLPITQLRDHIDTLLCDYTEKFTGARARLSQALEIIIIAYYASLLKQHADEQIRTLMEK